MRQSRIATYFLVPILNKTQDSQADTHNPDLDYIFYNICNDSLNFSAHRYLNLNKTREINVKEVNEFDLHYQEK